MLLEGGVGGDGDELAEGFGAFGTFLDDVLEDKLAVYVGTGQVDHSFLEQPLNFLTGGLTVASSSM